MTGIAKESDLLDFLQGSTIGSKWDAARHLMADRKMQAASARQEFRQAFRDLGEVCARAHGPDQLLAIALIVRISELIKGEYRREAARILSSILTRPPDGAWTISETKGLPVEAKPAEIREDIALALEHASGPWVIGYVIDALAREERSQRCRLELCRQLASRESSINRWLELLNNQSWSEISAADETDRVGRLRDLASALATTIRENRASLSVDASVGPVLSSLMQSMVRVSQRTAPPPKLFQAGVKIIELLEEILATEFTLIAEPDAYAPLAVLAKWWQPLPFPKALSEALKSVTRKLKSAVTLRARMGQRSETLVLRLAQSLGPGSSPGDILVAIADQEGGLTSDIDDWLRGRERMTSATSKAVVSMLSETGISDFVQAFAPLLLDCSDATAALSQSVDSRLAALVRRLCVRVDAIAIDLGLSVAGQRGDIVEYNPSLHRTSDGSIPPELSVRIIRPMVVRKRQDGSQDVLERAIVSAIEQGG